MSWLIASFWPYILAGGTALVAIASAYLKGRGDGKNNQLAKEAEVRAKTNKKLVDAVGAKPTRSVLDDPNNRDNRTR
jgi:hypothetical protein